MIPSNYRSPWEEEPDLTSNEEDFEQIDEEEDEIKIKYPGASKDQIEFIKYINKETKYGNK